MNSLLFITIDSTFRHQDIIATMPGVTTQGLRESPGVSLFSTDDCDSVLGLP